MDLPEQSTPVQPQPAPLARPPRFSAVAMLCVSLAFAALYLWEAYIRRQMAAFDIFGGENLQLPGPTRETLAAAYFLHIHRYIILPLGLLLAILAGRILRGPRVSILLGALLVILASVYLISMYAIGLPQDNLVDVIK